MEESLDRGKRTSWLRVVVTTCLTLVLALSATLALAGCGVSDEDASKKVVDSALDDLKATDSTSVESTLGSTLCDQIRAYGIDPADFYSALVNHFSYTDNGSTVDGDSATVSLTVTNVDFQSIYMAWQSDFTNYVSTTEAVDLYSTDGQDGVVKKGLQMLLDDLNADDAPTKTEDVTIDLTKGSDGSWSMSDQSQLTSALLAGNDIASVTSGSPSPTTDEESADSADASSSSDGFSGSNSSSTAITTE
ncbi:MAG: DUF5105 domain-containing protein [Atopobiaceae bacterium]|jgi:hypothetical protein|nr:DUF5105 domain-containing protein [Atopobiaceae bacterium]MCI2172905.1 DUF5105 domain-containing protein [Atopobiaceae bacterium]MCI2208310.1 DUF5105 domain-containing protein [Atopobiaceae bacterium]